MKYKIGDNVICKSEQSYCWIRESVSNDPLQPVYEIVIDKSNSHNGNDGKHYVLESDLISIPELLKEKRKRISISKKEAKIISKALACSLVTLSANDLEKTDEFKELDKVHHKYWKIAFLPKNKKRK